MEIRQLQETQESTTISAKVSPRNMMTAASKVAIRAAKAKATKLSARVSLQTASLASK